MEEVGPFVYKSKTIKDSDDNIRFYKDDTLTYRPRKIYTFDPVASNGKNPDDTFITVPNIPFWTGMNKARKLSGYKRNTATDIGKDGDTYALKRYDRFTVNTGPY